MKTRIQLNAEKLRRAGFTYSEIIKELGVKIPKATISHWLSKIPLSSQQRDRIANLITENGKKAAIEARKILDENRRLYLARLRKKHENLSTVLRNRKACKVALAMLYMGEGFKNTSGKVAFGNSDPAIIKTFLFLLSESFELDKRKLRFTLQCRADQNVESLEKFWAKVTRLPMAQKYKTQIDPRTLNKPTKNKDYRGVCRIDYLSSETYYEILSIIDIVSIK